MRPKCSYSNVPTTNDSYTFQHIWSYDYKIRNFLQASTACKGDKVQWMGFIVWRKDLANLLCQKVVTPTTLFSIGYVILTKDLLDICYNR